MEARFKFIEQLNSHGFSGVRVTRSLYVMFVDRYLSFCLLKLKNCGLRKGVYNLIEVISNEPNK